MKKRNPTRVPAAPVLEQSPSASPPRPVGNGGEQLLVLAEVRELLRGHLGRPLLKLFADLTGHRLHVLWHDPLEFHDSGHLPVLCPKARVRLRAGRALPADCALCHRDRWRPLDTAPGHGRLLQGACGATCFWAGLEAGASLPLTLALRAAAPSPRFDQAVQLLRQTLRESQAVLAAALAGRELAQVLSQQQVADASPAPSPPALAHADDANGRDGVRKMLDHLHANYRHPLALADVAAAMKMNASYLSSLFSTTMGFSFHRYLGELRLTKAKELLRNPDVRISAVAAAAGYSSPGHFNNVFKASVGISPSAWRAINTEPANSEPKSKES